MKRLLFFLLLLPTIAFSQVDVYYGTPWVYSTVDTSLLIKGTPDVKLHGTGTRSISRSRITIFGGLDTIPYTNGYVLTSDGHVLTNTLKKDRLQYVQTVTAKRQCLTGTGDVIDCLEMYTLFKVLEARNGYAVGKLVKGASVITDMNLFKLETPLVFMYTSVKDDK